MRHGTVFICTMCAETGTLVLLVPKKIPVTFDHNHGRVEFTIPEIRGHRMVSVDLA